MGPKVFISSTFYDLKSVREDIDTFIRNNYGFDTVMFENGDIGYTPGKPLDESCYRRISKSDMVVLIIGGMYGSPATGETVTEDKFTEYLSVTRKEFLAAKETGVPILTFIRNDVATEYEVYIKNYKDLEEKKKTIEFSATKHINVFRFIKLVKSQSNVVVHTFQKTSDIKDFLSKQWAEYLAQYLELMKTIRKNQEIEDSLLSLKNNIEQINLMVDRVGKKLFADSSSSAYEEIKHEQRVIDVKNILMNYFSFLPIFTQEDERHSFIREFVTTLSKMLTNKNFYLYMSSDPNDIDKFYNEFEFDTVIVEEIRPDVEIKLREYICDILQDEDSRESLIAALIQEHEFVPVARPK